MRLQAPSVNCLDSKRVTSKTIKSKSRTSPISLIRMRRIASDYLWNTNIPRFTLCHDWDTERRIYGHKSNAGSIGTFYRFLLLICRGKRRYTSTFHPHSLCFVTYLPLRVYCSSTHSSTFLPFSGFISLDFSTCSLCTTIS